MAAAAEAKFHVLAVDDSIIDRKLIERLLRSSSYQVTTVDSGSKALEFLGLRDDVGDSNSESLNNQEIDVSLVITDYCMPGMSGYDLLKRIKETSPLKNIPVVVMSSENVPSRISRCLEEGAEEFFLKPMRISYINKLAPHIMKGKQREEEQQQLPETIGGQEAAAVASAPPANQSGVGYKRKASSEGDAAVERSLSPDRTRQRFTVTA